jgi:hypothetical protein
MTFLHYIKNFYTPRWAILISSLILETEYIFFRHYTDIPHLHLMGAVVLAHVSALWITWKLGSQNA